jgi:hypothetical protein
LPLTPRRRTPPPACFWLVRATSRSRRRTSRNSRISNWTLRQHIYMLRIITILSQLRRYPLLLSNPAYDMFNDEALVELSHSKYWDGRYLSEQKVSPNGTQSMLDSYEWFRSFEQLRPFFEDNLPPSSSGCHILHLGCGNSVIILFPQWFLCAQHLRRLITSPNFRT